MSNRSAYIPALDGLRTFAVISVILYHMNALWLPCGLQGVTVFFVISGYLITGLLISEWGKTRNLDLPHFWMRRVRRLFPAIGLMLLVTIILTAIFEPALLTKMRQDLVAVLCFVTNWFYILRDVSYFDTLGSPSPVTHCWSLAIEEQFYLVWPVLLLIFFKLKVSKRALSNGIAVAAGLSALAMALLYNPDADPSRVYYGTDTRAFALLVGAWFAFNFPVSKLLRSPKKRGLSAGQQTLLGWAGVVSLILVIVFMVCVSGYSPFVYYGGTLIISILTGIVIISLVNPANPLARVLSLKPLVWTGVRSYGIYLWHFPLLLLMNPANSTTDPSLLARLVQLAVIIAVAALAFKFVEDPIRHGAIGRLMKDISAGKTTFTAWLAEKKITVALAALLIVAAGVCLVAVPDKESIGDLKRLQDSAESIAQEKEERLQSLMSQADEARQCSVLLIGDSVAATCEDAFYEAHPKGILDAQISRWFSAAPGLYQEYLDQGVVGNVVVFALGTNGAAYEEDVDELMKLVGSEKHVFFVTTRSQNDEWVEISNSTYWAAAEKYSNVQVIDWYSYSAGHDEYFDGDGTHPKVSQADVYIGLIDSVIGPYLPDEQAMIQQEEAINAQVAEAQAEAESARSDANAAQAAVDGY